MTHALKMVGLISALLGTFHLYTVLKYSDQLFMAFSALPSSVDVLVVTLVLPIVLVVAGVGVLLGKSRFPLVLGLALTGYLLLYVWGTISQFHFWLSHPEYREQLSWASIYGVLKYGALLVLLFLFHKKAQSTKALKADAVNAAELRR